LLRRPHIAKRRMASRWNLVKPILPAIRSSSTRQFTSLFKPSTPRTVLPFKPREIPWNSCQVPRRTLFWSRKKQPKQYESTTETVAKTAKTFGQLCYRFTLYSGVFVTAAIIGFFIYDVFCLVSSIDLSRKLIIPGDNQRRFKFHR